MPTYKITKSTCQLNMPGSVSRWPLLIESGIDDRDSAMDLAEVAASEHAARIAVPYEPCGNGAELTGFTFTTNNGTIVWYAVSTEES